MAQHCENRHRHPGEKTKVCRSGHLLIVLLIFFALGGVGCRSYEYYSGQQPVKSGSPKNRSAAAILSLPSYDGGYPNLALERVDDRFTPTLEKKFQIPPGVHEIVVTCEYTGAFGTKHYFGRQRLEFTAEAGRTYKAQVHKEKRDKRRCVVKLVDSSTKTVVSKTIPGYVPLKDDKAHR